VLTSTELYDPVANTFAPPSGAPTMPFTSSDAVLLPTGEVLFSGGLDVLGNPIQGGELYEPSSNTFSQLGVPMNVARYDPTATLLPNGQVLIAGGYVDSSGTPTATTELYTRANNTFAPPSGTATMNVARYGAIAVLLPNGKVLIAGGTDGVNFFTSTELYNPATNSFLRSGTATMNTGRIDIPPAVLLPNGEVLIVGGNDSSGNILSSSELYTP
jgi:hypothetical protein